MAEQLATLNKDSQEVKVLSFPISNRAITATWGSIYYGEEDINTGIDLTGRKVFATYNPSTNYHAWTYCKIGSSGHVTVGLCRASTGTLDGTIDLLIV